MISVDLSNVDAAVRALDVLADQFAGAVGPSLREEGEIEMTEAKRRTPVDTSALRNSGHVTGPRYGGRDAEVRLVFGGPAAPYAIFVHEDMEAWHDVGQAKFLESTLLESEPYLAQRLARRILSKVRT